MREQSSEPADPILGLVRREWRAITLWALLFSATFLARTAYDWLVPTTDFWTRANVSTALGVAILLAVAFRAAWRSRSAAAGIVITVATSLVAAVLSAAGVALMLALWHDPGTLRAIDGSGGLAEAFTLPFMMIVPALAMGTVGGALGSASRKIAATSA